MVESKPNEFTIDEIKENDGSEGKRLWVLIHGKVYDVTDFKHPGGRDAFLEDHGDDRKEDFDSIHTEKAKQQALKYYIGNLKKPQKKDTNSVTESTSSSKQEKPQRSVIFPILILVLAYFIVFKFNMLGLFDRKK